MGWFDEQIRQRIQNDDEMFADAFAQMANLVNSEKIISSFIDNRKIAEEAIADILKYYHIRVQEIPDNMKDINQVLEYLLRPSGIMRRTVHLSEGWQQDAIGAMLGTKKDGSIVAILSGKFKGYYIKDYVTGKMTKVTKQNASEIDSEAVCFYQPFPLRSLTMNDLLRYIFQQLHGGDYALLFGITTIVTILGMVTPKITRYLYDEVLMFADVGLLTGAILTLLYINIASSLFSIVRDMIHASISTKLNLAVESAVMMRVLTLPTAFFKKYSSGELSNRVSYMSSLCEILFETIFSTGLTAIFSLIYIGQIFLYASELVRPAILITLFTLSVSVLTAFVQMNITEKQMTEAGKENGLVYALINGISKIKNAGAEKRAFTKWSRQYVKSAKYIYQPPLLLKISGVLTTTISLVGTMVLYYLAIRSQISVADYMAFHSAYGMVSGAFASLAGIAVTIAKIKPILTMVQPILAEEPEVASNRHVVTGIRGSIELNNISFRYNESMPNVLDNLSLKIRSGQYVAIVGKTGCGKSTLMRILLGFEKPQKGAVYYDGKDISSMDLKSLRQKIGVVMQNGKLFQGDIYLFEYRDISSTAYVRTGMGSSRNGRYGRRYPKYADENAYINFRRARWHFRRTKTTSYDSQSDCTETKNIDV